MVLKAINDAMTATELLKEGNIFTVVKWIKKSKKDYFLNGLKEIIIKTKKEQLAYNTFFTEAWNYNTSSIKWNKKGVK